MTASWTTMRYLPTNGIVSMKALEEQFVDNVTYMREHHWHATSGGGVDASTNHGVTNSAGVWQNDASANSAISITLTYQCDVVVEAHVVWIDSAANDESCSFRIYNSSDSVAGEETGQLGSANASSRNKTTVIGRFSDVAAGSKTFRLQASRKDGTRTINILERSVIVKAYSSL